MLQRTVESIKPAQAEIQYGQARGADQRRLPRPSTHQRPMALDTLATLTPGGPDARGLRRGNRREDRESLAGRTRRPAAAPGALQPGARCRTTSSRPRRRCTGRGRFFTAESSAKIQAVYDYFALYQFRLAIVLTNYWRTKPDDLQPGHHPAATSTGSTRTSTRRRRSGSSRRCRPTSSSTRAR